MVRQKKNRRDRKDSTIATLRTLSTQPDSRFLDRELSQLAFNKWVRGYFESEVKPLLSPIGLDPSHPFPQVINKALNFVIQLTGKDAFGRASTIAVLKVPRVLPRVIPMPVQLAPGKQAFVLLSS